MKKFTLVTIEEVKRNYSFLTTLEGFDLYDDWDDKDFFIVADDDIIIDGNFCIDIYEPEEKQALRRRVDMPSTIDTIRIEGILVNGNISVSGCIINAIGDYGPFVFIKGDVKCQSLLAGGAHIEITGDVKAKEVVMTHYNHGRFNCSGLVEAPVFIVEDHYTTFKERKTDLFYYNDKTDNLTEVYDEELFPPSLAQHLDNPLTQTFEELQRDLEKGELVLKQSGPPNRDRAYWAQKINDNYHDLKRVPAQYKDREMCMNALNMSYAALPYVAEEFITPDLCTQLVAKDGFSIRVIPEQFITPQLCHAAALKGVVLSAIPKEFYTQELILEVFKNSTYQADITQVPAEFITEDFLVEYVKIRKGLWLDKACNDNNIDKQTVLNKAMDAGVEYLDNMFGHHLSQEVYDYASQLYNNDRNRQEWTHYTEKYKNKIERLKL